jgi:hypothetical protein
MEGVDSNMQRGVVAVIQGEFTPAFRLTPRAADWRVRGAQKDKLLTRQPLPQQSTPGLTQTVGQLNYNPISSQSHTDDRCADDGKETV